MCPHAYAGIKGRADALRDECEKRSLIAHAAHRLRGEVIGEGIVLREVQGLSYKEIADQTGIAEGTVMSRLFYARKKLQGLLEDLR